MIAAVPATVVPLGILQIAVGAPELYPPIHPPAMITWRIPPVVTVAATFPETRTTRGEFAQRGASRFAFRFTEPAGDAIVADGAAIWVYLPSSARGQVLKLPVAQGAQLDLLAQLLTTPRTTYRVTAGADTTVGGRPAGVFTLVPKAQNAPFTRARLWIDRTDALVRQVEAVELSGLVRRVRFRDVQSDVELPRDALTFAVPPNVKVLDVSGLMGNLKP